MMSCPPPALELLDEYWFFSNTLASSSSAERGQFKQSSPPSSGGCRTPSLPPPGRDDDLVEVDRSATTTRGGGNQQQQEQEVEDDDLNWSSIYEGVLRTRMAEASTTSSSRPSRPAALRRAPSMPVPAGVSPASSSTQQSSSSSSKPRSSSRRSSSARHHHQPALLARSRSISVFHGDNDKKWRSSGDLDSMEVQGFRDLGFVFDKDDSLAGGLKKPTANSRRPPALVRVQSEARSAAEVKDQLRMWAQAVACNVRLQEC